MNLAWIAAGSVLAVEFAVRCWPRQLLPRLTRTAHWLPRVLRSRRLPDERKQELLMRYARRMLGLSLSTFGVLCGIVLCQVAPLGLALQFQGGASAELKLLLSPEALVVMVLTAALYSHLRIRR